MDQQIPVFNLERRDRAVIVVEALDDGRILLKLRPQLLDREGKSPEIWGAVLCDLLDNLTNLYAELNGTIYDFERQNMIGALLEEYRRRDFKAECKPSAANYTVANDRCPDA